MKAENIVEESHWTIQMTCYESLVSKSTKNMLVVSSITRKEKSFSIVRSISVPIDIFYARNRVDLISQWKKIWANQPSLENGNSRENKPMVN